MLFVVTSKNGGGSWEVLKASHLKTTAHSQLLELRGSQSHRAEKSSLLVDIYLILAALFVSLIITL